MTKLRSKKAKGPDVANMLRQARLASGLSQRDVAKLMGVSQPTICALEGSRTVTPTVTSIARYAAALGLELRIELV